jgi:hypothetical protein
MSAIHFTLSSLLHLIPSHPITGPQTSPYKPIAPSTLLTAPLHAISHPHHRNCPPTVPLHSPDKSTALSSQKPLFRHSLRMGLLKSSRFHACLFHPRLCSRCPWSFGSSLRCCIARRGNGRVSVWSEVLTCRWLILILFVVLVLVLEEKLRQKCKWELSWQ